MKIGKKTIERLFFLHATPARFPSVSSAVLRYGPSKAAVSAHFSRAMEASTTPSAPATKSAVSTPMMGWAARRPGSSVAPLPSSGILGGSFRRSAAWRVEGSSQVSAAHDPAVSQPWPSWSGYLLWRRAVLSASAQLFSVSTGVAPRLEGSALLTAAGAS